MATLQAVRTDPISATRPSFDELVARAAELRPMLRERAAQTERDGRVSADSMAALADAGLLQLVKPARFGGWEYPPSVMLHVGAELARGCGSTAWCAMLANCNNWFAAYWPLAVQEEIWGDTPGALICGTVVPTGKCEKVEGGWNVWGRWPWASNCDNSQWAFVSAMLPPIDGAPQGAGWFLTPIDALRIDQNSWQVSGMQGTGSKTMLADEPFFLPDERMIRLGDIIPRRAPGNAISDNPLANFGFASFGGVPLIAAVIGMAYAALDEFVESMRGKVRATQPGATAAQNPFVLERVGHASAEIEASRALLLAELGRLEARVMEGYEPSVEDRLRMRRAMAFAGRSCTEAVNRLLEVAGASAADVHLPLQRIWRDVNAASRHLAFDANSIYSMMGQHMFGLEPTGSY